MKDIIIKGDRLKKEIIIWLICLAAAEAVNIYSIISYKTNWIELITQIHFVAALSILFYLAAALIRWLFGLIKPVKK